MEKKALTGKDLLLSFLFSPGIKASVNEPIVGRTKLTKMMFLFEKQIYSKFFKDEIAISLPDFEPYYFGPFSRELFEDLAFFESIGMICTSQTNIPLSSADKAERSNVFDDSDLWSEAIFEEESEEYELAYSLSPSGKNYVQEKVWELFSSSQKEKLRQFKGQINKISLDALLRYVYTTYPEETKKSKIADRYLETDRVEKKC